VQALFVDWAVFSLVLCVLSLGCGLLLERVAGSRVSGVLLLPCGFAVLSLAAQGATMASPTARAAVPLVLALAALGFVLSFRQWDRRPDPWALAAAVGVFAVYAAPIVLSGRATFAGYIKLDDDSTFLAMTDRVMEHGRSIAGLAPSSYLATLETNITKGYPLATFMPLGVGHGLLGVDSAWLFQPCLALMAAMLSLPLYELTARLAAPRALRGLAAFVGAQAALLYGYALWGGIKELATAWTLPLIAALVPAATRGTERPRALLPLAVACAVPLGVLNVGAGLWLAPLIAVAFLIVIRAVPPRAAVRTAVIFTGFAALLALPTLASARAFLSSGIVEFSPLANLAKPLSPLQILGVWPTGDFRFDPPRPGPVYALLAITGAAAVLGVYWAWRRAAWELALFVAGAVVSCFVIYAFSTPWIDAKALATASPALPFAAVVGAVPFLRVGRRIEGVALLVTVVGGVVWSNVVQAHDAWLAPRAQLVELERIGQKFAGDGPTLITEYQPYGARHFLRRLDGEGASELRIRPVYLRDGGTLPKGTSADLDSFRLDALLVYRTLVLRRSPVESRPPAVYRLVWRKRFYEVWQRPEQSGRAILEHLPLGSDSQPAAVPNCSDVLRLANRAGSRGRLATEFRPAAITVPLGNGSVPEGWRSGAGEVVPAGAGTVSATADVPTRGRYGVWLGGSFRDRLDLDVDGRRIAVRRNQLNNASQYTPLGSVELAPGAHVFVIHYDGPDLHPGSGGPQFPMGPLVLGSTPADFRVTYVQLSKARRLCGRNLDWIEALGS
jgi:hypothetical protein